MNPGATPGQGRPADPRRLPDQTALALVEASPAPAGLLRPFESARMVELSDLGKLAGGGAVGAALAVFYMFKAKWIVPGYIYEQAIERESRERAAREKSEQRLLESMPVLQQAHDALIRSMGVTAKAVEVAAEKPTKKSGVGG